MKTHNVIRLDEARIRGKTQRRVRLNADLQPERVLDYAEDGIVYRKGWIGTVIDVQPGHNHAEHTAVLFDAYTWPVWIDSRYLDPL